MEIILIRHGMTEGNKKHRFIGGKTDQPLCQEGSDALQSRRYHKVDMLFTSPMLRCRETAEIIYPGMAGDVIETFRECDFGVLEGKNHEELSGTDEYEKFLKGNGLLPFPGGETVETFNRRSRCALTEAVEKALLMDAESIACVVHGGTIMAVLSGLSEESGYYDWKAGNGEGYRFLISEDRWRQGDYGGALAGSIEHRIYT